MFSLPITCNDGSRIDPELFGLSELRSPTSTLDRHIYPSEFTLTSPPNFDSRDPHRQLLTFKTILNGHETLSPTIAITPSKLSLYRLEPLDGPALTSGPGLHVLLSSRASAADDSPTTAYPVLRDGATDNTKSCYHSVPGSDVTLLSADDGTPCIISITNAQAYGLPVGVHSLAPSNWFTCDTVQEGGLVSTVFGRQLHGQIFLELGGPDNRRVIDPRTRRVEYMKGSGGVMYFTHSES